MTDGSAEEVSLQVRAVVEILKEAARAGALRRADVDALAGALPEIATQVELPARPVDNDDVGWLEVERRRCGKKNCRCSKGGALHGPYVVRKWVENGRRRREHLGRLGRARAPSSIAPKLKEQIDRLNRMDLRFLHDD